jgi:hypothetical protein
MSAVLEFYRRGAAVEFCSRGAGKENAPVLFSSYFPSYYEFLLLLLTPIRTVYYLGDVHDERAVSLLNAHTMSAPVDGFEVIALKIS